MLVAGELSIGDHHIMKFHRYLWEMFQETKLNIAYSYIAGNLFADLFCNLANDLFLICRNIRKYNNVEYDENSRKDPKPSE